MNIEEIVDKQNCSAYYTLRWLIYKNDINAYWYGLFRNIELIEAEWRVYASVI